MKNKRVTVLQVDDPFVFWEHTPQMTYKHNPNFGNPLFMKNIKHHKIGDLKNKIKVDMPQYSHLLVAVKEREDRLVFEKVANSGH